jgi:hypothetical protein
LLKLNEDWPKIFAGGTMGDPVDGEVGGREGGGRLGGERRLRARGVTVEDQLHLLATLAQVADNLLYTGTW